MVISQKIVLAFPCAVTSESAEGKQEASCSWCQGAGGSAVFVLSFSGSFHLMVLRGLAGNLGFRLSVFIFTTLGGQNLIS